MDVHPDCEPIAFLLGTWRGEGKGHYPTIDDFGYREEVVFSHDGRPFFAYGQRTWSLDGDAPRHTESGYWRPKPGGRIELVIAQQLGVAEVEEGTIWPNRIEVHSTALARTSSSKEVRQITRVFEVVGDRLIYDLAMAAVGVELQHHLHAELQLVP